MCRCGWVPLFACAAILSACSGCLFVRHSTRVIRENEPQRPVRFESEQAQNLFEGPVAELKSQKTGSNPQVFFIPFLCWYSREDVLSDAAVYNDQIAACDTNGDQVISLEEAAAYRAVHDAKIRAEQAKQGEAQATAARPIPQDLRR